MSSQVNLTLTIRLEAVEITPAERHVKQRVVLGVRDPTVAPVQWCVHVLRSPESTSLPASQTLKMQSMNTGKSRLQQNHALKNTWTEEEGTVSDLSLRWSNFSSNTPRRGSWFSKHRCKKLNIFILILHPSTSMLPQVDTVYRREDLIQRKFNEPIFVYKYAFMKRSVTFIQAE